ncbi:MAG: CPBP family intramembrane metalloprotease, partial [Lachnospiraceae bacterium]|nr:CPBP family intramembrane metalloprotease [Lachnospiraceae bacterium]
MFKLNVSKKTGIAALTGLIMIALSLLMIPFDGDSVLNLIVSFILRDVFMIFGLGVVFVSLYSEKMGDGFLKDLGFTKRKWVASVIINVVLAAGLLAMFMKEQVPENIISINNLYGASYILVAGIFEMTFIYGYLRMSFEKAFGIVPAIILTSVFYSFHHAGFQPEFAHLFFVGLMYCSVFYITRNLLVIFPFFWGVGALWDVLVSSEAGNQIKNLDSFIIAAIILAASVSWILFRRGRKNVIKNINSN